MFKAYRDAHRLRDGAIVVYTRPGAKKPNYHARLKIPGVPGYVIRALKTRDLAEALNGAEDLFYTLKAEQRVGLDVRMAGNLKFKDFQKRFYAAHEAGLSVHRQQLHKLFAAKYLIPYFGEERVADMPDAFVERYWDWRINYHDTHKTAEKNTAPLQKGQKKRRRHIVFAPRPSQKTLAMEAGMLKQMFRWGKRVGFVKREPWIKPPKVKHTRGVERRPSFTEAEWKDVYEHMRAWVDEPLETEKRAKGGALTRKGPNAMHRYQRELLRDYLLFMANSGLRPNEARQLRWRDLRVEGSGRGAVLVVEVAESTKTGARTVVCREGTHVYVNRLKQLSRYAGDDDLVFAGWGGEPVENFNKTFQAILKHLKLLTDREGKKRTVYSLRHFYCTQALLSGVDIHVLAKNMGTSIAYIEQHYSHVLTLTRAKELRKKRFRPS